MPGIPITIVGELYDNRLTIGGGPIIPPPKPEHPIVIPPDSIAPGVPTHPIYLPPPKPEHPIVIPPDSIAPGVPTHPIYLPPQVEHPIVIPPDAISPGVPAHPIYLPPQVEHPIVIPPTQPPTDPPSGDGKWVYSPIYGWVWQPSGEGGKPVPPG